MKLSSKKEFLEASLSLRLGNRVRTWNSLNDLIIESNKPSTVTIRHKIPNSNKCTYQVPINNLGQELDYWKNNSTEFFFNENPRDDRITLQGEVWRGVDGLYLNYSYIKKPMRQALSEQSLHAERSKAKALLEYFMDANSLDDIYALLDLYSEAVIEFTTYDYELGVLPHRNTLIWEVRNY